MLPHHRFRPRLLDTLRGYRRTDFLADLGAGLTVGVVALPLAMAFAIASGVKPEQGLFTAILAGLLISGLGGSSVQIGGPAGAFIVVVYGIVQRYGVPNLLVATMMAGVLLLAMGWLRVGALVRQMPVSIISGFTNGIAVLIALSQLKDFLGLPIASMPAGFFGQVATVARQAPHANLQALLLGAGCLAGLMFWSGLGVQKNLLGEDRRTNRWLRFAARIPGPIVALVTLTALAGALDLHVETIGSRFGGIPRTLPALQAPAVSWDSVQQLFVPALTIALLGAIESLLCARVADGVAPVRRHDPNQELMAQGVANLVAPLFGGLPATGTIARTLTNIRAGGRTPVAGILHAVTLLLVMLAAAPLAARVPLAALSGILLYVAWNMLEPREFLRLHKDGVEYAAKFLCTFVLTVVLDLTVAVEVGLALACMLFVYRMGTLFGLEADTAAGAGGDVRVFRLYGALFFGAAGKVESLADELPPGVRWVILEANYLLSIDTSGQSALETLGRELARRDIGWIVCGLHRQPQQQLDPVTTAHWEAPPVVLPDLPAALRRAEAPAPA
ncbi:MAG: STAS domain-containing protein [Burkholderiales bacterium]|nr:STAS domain-containing protein [Burkholderiales bacterium]